MEADEHRFLLRRSFVGLRVLVGYSTMLKPLFEPLREWVYRTRRSKGSKKPSSAIRLEGARESRFGGSRTGTVSDEIILCLEQPCGEFITEQRSSGAIWLNIKQLTEPQLIAGELISTRPI